ncbi:hypothetical protein [Halomonas sp. E14]|uniref:hypothetical protein n=2 Tax=unclassified Halomonas TaxID=2609666 RepID=UPI00403EA7B8
MIKISDLMTMAGGLALMTLPLVASAATLSLPADARLAMSVIDVVSLDAEQPRRDDILLRPAVSGSSQASHELPEYCIVVGDARVEGERMRITTKALTCIQTNGSESEIYSGELSAAAYEQDGSFGLAVCEEDRCSVTPDQAFYLQLASPLTVEQQDNPGARINEQRRQADGRGVANPIPAERPNPDAN